jgi:hypothetical protein
MVRVLGPHDPVWKDIANRHAHMKVRRAEREVKREVRRRLTVELRGAGMTFREIGMHLGISGQEAYRVFKEWLDASSTA